MHSECTQFHTKMHKHSKCYTATLIFVMIFTKWTSRENNCHGVLALYVFYFSKYIISLFHYLVKDVPTSDNLNTESMERLRQEQSADRNLDWHHALKNSAFGFMTTNEI